MYTFVAAIVAIVVVGNLFAISILIYTLISGSYKSYIEKRIQHLEQVRRVRNALSKGDEHDW